MSLREALDALRLEAPGRRGSDHDTPPPEPRPDSRRVLCLACRGGRTVVVFEPGAHVGQRFVCVFCEGRGFLTVEGRALLAMAAAPAGCEAPGVALEPPASRRGNG